MVTLCSCFAVAKSSLTLMLARNNPAAWHGNGNTVTNLLVPCTNAPSKLRETAAISEFVDLEIPAREACPAVEDVNGGDVIVPILLVARDHGLHHFLGKFATDYWLLHAIDVSETVST